MNIRAIRGYAPQARRDFIQAVTDRAAYFGLTATKVEPVKEKGDSVLIGGRAFPRKVGEQRQRLEERVRRHGFQQTMETLAYTWFNRLVAIRFMELHDYLENGEGGASYRVLTTNNTNKHESNASSIRGYSCDSWLPEILEKAEHVALESLDRQKIIDLKLDGAKEVELYRLLLIAECNALNAAMPFLFERIDDETELVLPDNLLHSDSLIRKLVNEIDEEDWQQVEIIGWLYQFYISEKKDEVIGKVVASADIPAATQLFTPNWIVKYLVQNTLGRQWLATYPHSALRQQMAYYIEPAEQTPEVQEQLRAVTPTSLNPEEITLLDPACGSGHILVEAYDLFKAIYQERGYRARDIPRLILQKNLFGLEIDDRAAQLAAFALMMKARADDRRIFSSETRPNVLAIQESKGLDARSIAAALNAPILKEKLPPSEYLFEEIEDEENPLFSRKAMGEQSHVSQTDVASLLELFEDAKTFGSLIQVPPKLAEKLPSIEQRLKDVLKHGDLTHASAGVIAPLLRQAHLLSQRYDAVVANPPYMGGKYFSGRLKDFVAKKYKKAKADLYACFIQRNVIFSKLNGFVGMITIPNWMFLSSFEKVRQSLFDHQTIDTFIHNGRGVFGSDFGSCTFAIRNHCLPAYRGIFRRLFDKQGSVSSNEELRDRLGTAESFTPSNKDFAKIPGSPVAYWVSERMRKAFANNYPLSSVAAVKQGMSSADNPRFTREWWEVSVDRIGFSFESRDAARNSKRKWFPYNKGGSFRKWYGNLETLIDWHDDGSRIRQHAGAAIRNSEFFFREGVTWTDISSSCFGVRLLEKGALFANTGSCCFSSSSKFLLGFLASPVAFAAVRILNPSLHTEIGDVSRLPLVAQESPLVEQVEKIAEDAIAIARYDWDSFEKSWNFQAPPILQHNKVKLQQSHEISDTECVARFSRMKELEEENNFLFIHAYDLQGELSLNVPDDQITLSLPDRLEDAKRLLSYAIGCMMGRYSLNKPGLIYAHSGNQDFEKIYFATEAHGRNTENTKTNELSSSVFLPCSSVAHSFLPDDDGIIPLLDADWGIRDDAAGRIVEFIGVAWPREHLEENLKFIAESLGPTKNEHSRDTIRRYLATGFYKDHLRWYKRRPIYWLFSSGKQRAFQCLVYLHRYHEGTLARMRTEYVIPLQGKIAARIEQLEADKTKATSTAHGRKLQKEQDDLKRQQTELFAFDEKLKHAADQKIALDLDDGVKVNYGKFGDLLAEVKAVCGTKEE